MHIEQNEEARFEILRDQAEEIANQQNVVTMLRERLEIQIGELTEARQRCNKLEAKIVGPANHASRLAANIVQLQEQAQADEATWSGQLAALRLLTTELQQKQAS